MTEDLLNHYRDLLVNEGYHAEVVIPNTLKIQFHILGHKIDASCIFPDTFPYQFPFVQLSEDTAELCKEFAHRFKKDYLCLFNPADAKPAFLYPDQVLLATIKKAESVLFAGFTGDNEAEFTKEFLEYWNQHITSEFILFSHFPDQISLFYASHINKYSFVLASDKNHLDCVVSNIFHDKALSKEVSAGLYIPLSKGFCPFRIKTERDMWEIISMHTTSDDKQCINAKMQATRNQCKLFVVSFPSENDQRVYLGWISSGFKSIDGFRSDHISPFVYWKLQSNNQLSNIMSASVTQCSQEYLYHRGSYGFEHRFESVAIVGCGSVGGEIAVQLSTMGTNQFALIDNDVLTTDNIARHVCGYDFVGLKKTQCLQYLLQHSNPNINCTVFSEDAFQAIARQIDLINQTECMFVAVGDIALEAFIMKMAEDGKLKVPLVLWVEPRCYAGHLIYISHPNRACEVLIAPDTLTYRGTVIKGSSFVEHLPGCSAGFIPYSGLDVKQFISRSLHELSRMREHPALQGNYHYVWIGELSEARRQGIEVSKEYAEVPDFSFIVKRFD